MGKRKTKKVSSRIPYHVAFGIGIIVFGVLLYILAICGLTSTLSAGISAGNWFMMLGLGVWVVPFWLKR